MIGHYVNSFTPEQEDRVLTRPMQAGTVQWASSTDCLISTALGGFAGTSSLGFVSRLIGASDCALHAKPGEFIEQCPVTAIIARRYDSLCQRFGVGRANAAIRNRILSNRARRTLQNRPVQMETVTP